MDNSLPKPNRMSLNRLFNSVKREKFPWMSEISSRAPMIAIQQVERAFRNFFAGRAEHPKFRSRASGQRFSLTNESVRVDGHSVHLPMVGRVRMAQEPRFSGKLMAVSVSRKAHRWFISFSYEMPEVPAGPTGTGIVGVDLGLRTLATLSDGTKIPNPRPHERMLISRKKKGSRNRRKANDRLARLRARVAGTRNDALHKLTTDLVSRFAVIGIEDLDVKGMQKNRKIARGVADSGFGEFRRQLAYKAGMSGTKVVVADRYYAS
jgi:putative transposase